MTAENAPLQALIALSRAVDARDRYTYGHSARVSRYAEMIAAGEGMTLKECAMVKQAALLHDIGKIGVPDDILKKPSALDDTQWGIMKTHTVIGGDILNRLTLLPHCAECARYHHERYDGGGYMAGLKGTDIPVCAAIVAVADAFDAMTTARSYREGISAKQAALELLSCAGSQLHPVFAKRMAQIACALS